MCAPSPSGITTLRSRFNVGTTRSTRRITRVTSVVFTTIGPNVVVGILDRVASDLGGSSLIISVTTNIALSRLTHTLNRSQGVVHTVPGAPTLIGTKVASMAPGTLMAPRSATSILGVFHYFNRTRMVTRPVVRPIINIDNSSPTCMFVFVRTVTSTTILNKVPHTRTCGFTTRTMVNSTGVILRAKRRPKTLGSVIYSPKNAAVRTMHMLRRGNFHTTIVRTVAGYVRGSRGLDGS